MIKKKEYVPSPEQQITINKLRAIDKLARDSGFDDDAFAHTEFSLIPFFESIVEECAKVAEMQSRNYTGENNEGIGCRDSATAIRTFGKNIGNV
jgi:hypothetical protein